MSPRRNEYTDTVRDLKALIAREAAAERRQTLTSNVDKMAAQLERQKDQLTDLRVLTERVDGLVWLVRGIVVALIVEVGAGVAIALIVKGHA